jgi:uncharacterized protein
MGETVGTVATLSRFPVKSMQGEQLAAAELTGSGLVGARAYALVETETGKVMSGKNPRLGTQLLGCRAAFVETAESGDEPPPVRITLPDGTAVTSDARDADATLSGFLGREVTLQRAAPEDFTIDQYHPDVEDLDPEGHRDTVTESKLGTAFFAQAGMASPVPAGFVPRSVPRLGADDLDPRPASGTSARESLRRAPVPHERRRGHP